MVNFFLQKKFVHLQRGLWEDENNSYHPDFLMIDQVFEHYHQVLKFHQALLEFLIPRKIDPDYVDCFI